MGRANAGANGTVFQNAEFGIGKATADLSQIKLIVRPGIASGFVGQNCFKSALRNHSARVFFGDSADLARSVIKLHQKLIVLQAKRIEGFEWSGRQGGSLAERAVDPIPQRRHGDTEGSQIMIELPVGLLAANALIGDLHAVFVGDAGGVYADRHRFLHGERMGIEDHDRRSQNLVLPNEPSLVGIFDRLVGGGARVDLAADRLQSTVDRLIGNAHDLSEQIRSVLKGAFDGASRQNIVELIEQQVFPCLIEGFLRI